MRGIKAGTRVVIMNQENQWHGLSGIVSYTHSGNKCAVDIDYGPSRSFDIADLCRENLDTGKPEQSKRKVRKVSTDQRGDIHSFAKLKEAAASLHYWEDARRQHVSERDKAIASIEHADERIADHSAKVRTLVAELNLAGGSPTFAVEVNIPEGVSK